MEIKSVMKRKKMKKRHILAVLASLYNGRESVSIIAWLCLLGLYLVVSQLAKIKVHLETSSPPTVHSTR